MGKWIDVNDRMPEEHDAGVLKMLGIEKRSDKCIVTITDGTTSIVDNDAETRDGNWHSDVIRFLQAGKKEFSVIAWMPLPKPYIRKD